MMQYSVLYYVSPQEDGDITSKINTKAVKTTRPNINLEALEKNKSADHKVVYLNLQEKKIPVLHTKIHYHNRALRTKHRLTV